jgi:hypothetical protein
MGVDKKIMELSRTIYQTSIMSHGAKKDPSGQIDKIRFQQQRLMSEVQKLF